MEDYRTQVVPGGPAPPHPPLNVMANNVRANLSEAHCYLERIEAAINGPSKGDSVTARCGDMPIAETMLDNGACLTHLLQRLEAVAGKLGA